MKVPEHIRQMDTKSMKDLVKSTFRRWMWSQLHGNNKASWRRLLSKYSNTLSLQSGSDLMSVHSHKTARLHVLKMLAYYVGNFLASTRRILEEKFILQFPLIGHFKKQYVKMRNSQQSHNSSPKWTLHPNPALSGETCSHLSDNRQMRETRNSSPSQHV